MNHPASVPRLCPARRRGGFALIVTLIVIVLLSVIIVSFLSSMSLERTTAGAYTNHSRAEGAADAAVSLMMSSLSENIRAYPDSATAWEVLNTGTSDVPGEPVPVTMLYLHAVPNAHGDKPDPNGDNTPTNIASEQTFVLPLISGASVKLLAQKGETVPALVLADPNARKQSLVDINSKSASDDLQGWVGTAPNAPQGPTPMKVPWVELKDGNGSVVSRYAYWVEDESFRANANLMGATPRGSNTPGVKPSEIPLQGLALPTAPPTGFAQNAVAMRGSFVNGLFLDPRAFNQVDSTYKMGDAGKFLFTLWSSGLELSRSGGLRLNLNDVIAAEGPDPAPADIREGLDRIIQAIKHDCPNFGQRFYRTVPGDLNGLQVVNDDPTIYLNKIAANIQDYIDTDNQPTIVLAGGAVGQPSTFPNRAINSNNRLGPNSIWAMGKESVPLITEFLMRLKVLQTAAKTDYSVNAKYNVIFDYYVELWNMTNQPITLAQLGSSPFLKVCNQFPWHTGVPTDNPTLQQRDGTPRDVVIRLDQLPASTVFPPNSVTVITTDAAPPAGLVAATGQLITIPQNAVVYADSAHGRNYIGRVSYTVSGYNTMLIETRSSAPSYTSGNFNLDGFDTLTELFFANANGYLDSQACALPIENNNILVDAYNGSRIGTSKTNTNACFFRGGTILGNRTAALGNLPGGGLYSCGDPRTNNEMLNTDYDSLDPVAPTNAGVNATPIHTRFFMTNNRSATNRDVNFPAQASLGRQDSAAFPVINGAAWFDQLTPSTSATAAYAPAVVASRALDSIGQLGDIFDPRREAPGSSKDNVAANLRYSRGGGRSLAIGQPEDPKVWDGTQTSLSRNWTAWRLTDIFSAAPADDPATPNVNESIERPGRINLNGVNRDNGAALKALLSGYIFQDGADSRITGAAATLNAGQGVQALVSALQTRLNSSDPNYQGPMFERGELSELTPFHNASVGELLGGVKMSDVNDRAREEIVRRLIELTTTRGSVFSIYAVGQSVKPLPGGRRLQGGLTAVNVTGTYAKKVTFQLMPVFDPPLPAKPAEYDPTNAASIQQRFAKPARYDIKILASRDRF